MPPSPTHPEFRRILIVKPSSMGDIIHALPILDGLRQRYPSAHIAWLVGVPFVDLVCGHPSVNEVIPFDRARFGRVGRSPGITMEFLRFLRSLRQRRFDLAIDLQGLFRSGFLTRASGAAVRIGPPAGRELSGMFYTERYPPRPADAHAVEHMWAVAEVLGFADRPKQFRLSITDADREAIRGRLRARQIDPGRGYVAVFPGARQETKRWPAAHFAALIDRLSAQTHLDIVLAGSTAEVDMCRTVGSLSATASVNLAGETTRREVIALIEAARLVITNDSGPMHVADVLHRPMVAIFGPTNPLRTGPYHHPESVVQLDLPCLPCYLRHLDRCRQKHACMNRLDVDRVAQAALERLSKTDGV